MIFLQLYARNGKKKLEKIHVKIYIYFVFSNYTIKKPIVLYEWFRYVVVLHVKSKV